MLLNHNDAQSNALTSTSHRDIFPDAVLPGRIDHSLRGSDYHAISAEEARSSSSALKTASPGSVYLLDSPIKEAFIRNSMVYAAIGFRMRPEHHDARLEVLEFARLEGAIPCPFWIQSSKDGRQALVIGTLQVIPAQTQSRDPMGAMPEAGLYDRSWRSGTMTGSFELCPEADWIDSFPDPVQKAALRVVSSHLQELKRAVEQFRSENSMPVDLRSIGELLDLGLVTEHERADCLNGMRDYGFIRSYGEPHGSSRTTVPRENSAQNLHPNSAANEASPPPADSVAALEAPAAEANPVPVLTEIVSFRMPGA